MNTTLVVLVVSSVALLPAASAQENINTDRPGFLFSPSLVPTSRLQVELGFPTLTWNRSDGVDATTTSFVAQARYGLNEHVELRAGGALLNFVSARGGDDEFGGGDLELGAKFALHERAGALDDTWLALRRSALITSVRLPTGDDDFTSGRAAYSANWALGFEPAGPLAYTALVGLSRSPVGGENAWTGTLAALGSHALDERWSVYGEVAHFVGIDVARDATYFGVGTTFLARSDVQLDVSADFGVGGDAVDATAALGVAWRW